MAFTETLLKIGRKYTENEILQTALNEVSKLKVERGANEAYIKELESVIGEDYNIKNYINTIKAQKIAHKNRKDRIELLQSEIYTLKYQIEQLNKQIYGKD